MVVPKFATQRLYAEIDRGRRRRRTLNLLLPPPPAALKIEPPPRYVSVYLIATADRAHIYIFGVDKDTTFEALVGSTP